MNSEHAEMSRGNNRGAIIGLFGVILIILGALNTMLSWRGGLDVHPFHAMLIGTGLLLCLIGAIRRHA
ncbi:MAG: hypothetical protein QGF38_13925 [Rhodospirillales bacterium]|jgi:hypothetical protein|nr:hypothetical protein [Rhodospirillales bacterium]